MKKKEAVNYFGTPTKLAVALGIKPEAVYQWGEYIPVRRAYELQDITNGVLRVSRKLICAA